MMFGVDDLLLCACTRLGARGSGFFFSDFLFPFFLCLCGFWIGLTRGYGRKGGCEAGQLFYRS